MRIAVGTAALAGAFLLTGGPAAFAAYNPQQNTTLNVNLPVPVPSLGTGSLTFNLQQGVQSTLNGAGINLPYTYVVVGVNGSAVAYVDPFALYRD